LELVEKDRKRQVAKNIEEARKPLKQEVKVDPNATAVCKFCGVTYKLVENKRKSCMGQAFHTLSPSGAEEKKDDRLMTCRWCKQHYYFRDNSAKACSLIFGAHQAVAADELSKKVDDQKISRTKIKAQAAIYRQRFPKPEKPDE